jgi:epoxyqueuosine reductase
MNNLALQIRERAQKLGFHRMGFARAGEIPEDHQRYLAWLSAGNHGEMGYLERNAHVRRRLDSEFILEGAKTVIVCALAYRRLPESMDAGDMDEGATEPGPFRIARYARGRDYHNFFRKRLQKLAATVRDLSPGHQARAMVDTAPVLERAWAQRAGVGFVGKNGCVIVPGIGSFVLLGEVVTTLEIEPDAAMESRCGECTLCLQGCPTRAFTAPYVLDARKCISYLTIEQRGTMDVALRDGVGSRLFGCDDCQDVCPYNRTSVVPEQSTREFALDPRWSERTLEDLAGMNEEQFRSWTEGTPLSRPGRNGLRRNALVVMGNSRKRRHLPVLRTIAMDDGEDAMVRETARWALAKVDRTED